MPQEILANRVAILERKVESLEGLPDRVASLELHISQFREEVRLEFSAVRGEIRSLAEALRADIRAGDEETRRQMRVLHEDVIARIAFLGESLNGRRPASKPRGRKGKRPRSPKG